MKRGQLGLAAILLFGGILLIGLSSACQPKLTEADCFQLLDRYTDKVIDQARPDVGPVDRAELIVEARKKAELDPAFAECSARVSRSAFQCAMEAHNADQIERCLL